MEKNVLLLGVKKELVSEFRRQLDLPGFNLFSGSTLDDTRSIFARTHIDHVFIGGGIDLKTRIEIIQEIYHTSDRTTVHLKDQISGPEGFVPFAKAVLVGLNDYEFIDSHNARSEIPSKGMAQK